jgi:DNA-binding NtrC family response regulator
MAKRLRILVVEDDSTFRDTVREILQDQGYKVRGARNLSKAAKRLTRHNFDLVLSDMDIGDGSGVDVVEIAKQTMPDAPVIIMSARAESGSVQNAMDSGAARFLPKPFTMKQLLAAVEGLLKEMSEEPEEPEDSDATQG